MGAGVGRESNAWILVCFLLEANSFVLISFHLRLRGLIDSQSLLPCPDFKSPFFSF